MTKAAKSRRSRKKLPALSVVVATATAPRQLTMMISSILAQTIADRIELVISLPGGEFDGDITRQMKALHSVKILTLGHVTDVDHEAGKVVFEARAPFVASIEDHAFPDADWAEAILDAFTESKCVAVGSAMLNANPSSVLSWANILLAYSQWTTVTPQGPIDWVSHHNGAFRRKTLHELGPNFWLLFNREGDIITELRNRGGQLFFAPTARVRHINASTWRSTMALRVDAGRLYAARRVESEKWRFSKRLLYSIASPLIPILRYSRMRKKIFFVGRRDVSERKHGLALAIGLVFDAIGQMLGYLAGEGEARARLAKFEVNRMDHLTAHDRAIFQS